MMLSESAALLSGLIFGGSNGISPGPLSLLTVSETLRGGVKEGFKVACSPLITDLPIITLSVFVFSRLTNKGHALSLISMAGALFLFFLAYKSVTFRHEGENGEVVVPTVGGKALIRGVLTNFLNPYPYLFWITVGAPYVIQLQSLGAAHVAGFFLMFYVGMLAAKAAVIVATARGKQMLTSRGYLICMRGIGCLMIIFGLRFMSQSYALWSAS